MEEGSCADLLQQLLDNQLKESVYFTTGLVPSYRYNSFWRYNRPDQNLFFTAISVFTIQRLFPLLKGDEVILASQFIENALPRYVHFRNKDGLATYNFYETRPLAHFPHGWLMHRFRHFQLPDDIDDTAMVYLTSQPSESDLIFLSSKLAQHANGTRLSVQNTFLEYRNLRAYSTWFGLNMPIEFDACAMTNMLYAVYEFGLPIDQHALESMVFLSNIIKTDRYRTDPFKCAHNYARPALIQYHLARLIGLFDPAPLRQSRQKLIADLYADFASVNSRMDQLLIAVSLFRLGQKPPSDIPLDGIEAEFSSFSFFIAGMLSAYTQSWIYRWANHPFWHIRWRCDDHCRVLVLEYMVLSQTYLNDAGSSSVERV